MATVVVVALLACVLTLLVVFGTRSGTPEAGESTASASPSASSSSASASGSASSSPSKSSSGGSEQGKGDSGLRNKVQNEIGQALENHQTGFRVASFNVLGASHTAPGGNKHGWARGPARMRTAVSLLEAQGATVAGLQEFEPPQARTFLARTHGAWSLYPGLSEGAGPVRDSIAWRNDTWSVVEEHTIPIPYFHGARVPMPYVLLKHRQTGAEVWMINVHNPATTSHWGNNARWRRLALGRELQLVRQLHSDGTPVLLTGDFNDKRPVLCAVQASGLMAPAGGTGGCSPPRGSSVDWIFGTPQIEFSQVAWRRSALLARTTDHPLLVATAVIPSEE